MKQRGLITILLLSVSFVWASAQEIEVPQTQAPLIVKRTASWCSLCGGWGWGFFRNLLDDNADKALVLAAHHGGSSYEQPASIELVNAFGGFGQPIFYLNGNNVGANSGNTAQVRQTVATLVDAINDGSPTAQTGLLAFADTDAQTLEVRSKTRFFEGLDEAVSLAIYIVQPTFIGAQAGQGSNAEHKNIFRLSLSGGAFGESLGTSFAAGTEETRSFSLPFADLQAAGISDLSGLGSGQLIVAAVLWTGTGNDRQVLNTHHTVEGMPPPTSAQAPQSVAGFSLFPSPATTVATAEIELNAAWPQAELSLFSADGQRLMSLHRGALAAGPHRFEIAVGQLPAGTYFLRLSDGKGVLAKPLIVHP